MRKLPPLRSLQAFEAAARLGSFKAAAVELHVTPTAISHQIGQLEDVVGERLFQRQPRPLRLTAAGARLYPSLQSGFDALAGAVACARAPGTQAPLRVTSPNAFASRWLVPRLPDWRASHPDMALEIIGTDAVLDLRTGEADVAIRYARTMPAATPAQEICRDSYFPICRPELLDGVAATVRAGDLLRLPLIHFDWMNRDPLAPTWRQWVATARSIDPALALPEHGWALSFREELHALDAVLAGQGIAICSDVVTGAALRQGTLVKAHPLALPGYGFYLVALPGHPRQAAIAAFAAWLSAAV